MKKKEIEPIPITCTNCNNPFAYRKFINNRIYRITGTARVAGVYKEKGKVVAKEYAHYPSCKDQRAKEIRILI